MYYWDYKFTEISAQHACDMLARCMHAQMYKDHSPNHTLYLDAFVPMVSCLVTTALVTPITSSSVPFVQLAYNAVLGCGARVAKGTVTWPKTELYRGH